MPRKRVKKSGKDKKETLNRFLKDLYLDKVCFKLTEIEVNHIREAVLKLVSSITTMIGLFDHKFKISEVILVGSAKEGTQIIVPEEYDFLLVLESLSQRGTVQIKKVCSEKENCVHVILNRDMQKRQFIELLRGEELMGTQDESLFSRKNGLREEFYIVLKEAVRRIADEKAHTPSGVLKLCHPSVKVHGPAFNPSFQWQGQNGKSIEISVDLCPVIRFTEGVSKLISEANVTCDAYYECALATGSFMLMPCKKGYSCRHGLCFSVIFTETEMSLMKDLHEHHRKCYKILKYLLNAKQRKPLGGLFDKLDNIVEPPTAFFSYILKVLVLNHHYQEMCTETECLATCIVKVLHAVWNISYFARIVIPGIPPRNYVANPFFKHHNICSGHSVKLADQELQMKLRLLLLYLEVISDMEKYEYKNCPLETVRGMRLGDLAKPVTAYMLVSLFSIYVYPELGHLLEETCYFLIYKHIELGKIIWLLLDPLECQNETCCMPVAQRKELMKREDLGFSEAGIYFIAAVEVSVLAVYMYPDCGHMIEDMGKFLFKRLQKLWKQV